MTDYLDIISVWYRDVLMFKAMNDANHLIFQEEIQYIKRVADRSSYEGLEKILDALEKAKARLRANVSFELTMELLFLTIQENTWNMEVDRLDGKGNWRKISDSGQDLLF